jgi:putative ATP-binding cassette transporter
MLIITGITALVSGACNAGLIALVNTALNRPAARTALLVAGFVALGLGKIVSGFFSQLMLTRFAQATIANLRQDLVRRILKVPLRYLEQVGAPKLMVALTDDIFNITQALLGLPVAAMNAAILLGGAAYLGWLSWKVLLFLCIFSIIGGLTYRLLIERGFRSLHLAREEEDKLFAHFRGLTEGIKELKLHRNRRGVFLNENIGTATENYQKHNVTAESQFILAQSWNHLLFYALIGLLLFLLPGVQSMSKETLTGYIITTLYLMGPLAGILSSLSLFGRASVAFDKIEQLGVSLAAKPEEDCSLTRPEAQASFKQLALVGVTHSYHNEKDDSHFVLGPISLEFQPGELVFLAGGNGSGKSTLAKIITGLYPPESGEIRLDGRAITDANRDDFRQLFSVVFSDFYLFESLLGLDSARIDAQARDYLSQLHLNHKVRVQNGTLSTTALSQGQRKRLALLTAYLEDRPFYVFDEWASDQDPWFKEIFYTRLLPELKARGKAVLVITHDEKYFHVADRLEKLDYGKLISDSSRVFSLNGKALEFLAEESMVLSPK